MPASSVTVLGGGVAGLAAALLLARDGHRVTLIERDPLPLGAPEDAPGWPRKGIPHFLQPHAFIPRGREELRSHFPDVYADLLAAGAQEVDLRRKLPGEPVPEDEACSTSAPAVRCSSGPCAERSPASRASPSGTASTSAASPSRAAG
jgi:glycine/D-amino acid oxidase-like deaminating enzyme